MNSTKKLLFLLSILCILLLGFLLRFSAFDQPLATNAGEGFRDLLVARHIYEYGEFPVSGYNNGFSTIDNSPLYFYVVALMALPSATFMGLGIANILFQMGLIALVGFLAYKIFGRLTALVAMLLLALSPHYITTTASFVWPPYFPAFFVVLSLLFLWYAHTKNRKYYTLVSGLSMLVAFALHPSAAPVVLVYIPLVIGVTRQQSYTLKNYIFHGMILLSVTFLFFIPSVISTGFENIDVGTRLHTYSPTSFSEAITRTTISLPYLFGLRGELFKNTILIIFLLLIGTFFRSQEVSKKHKEYVGLIFVFLSVQIAAAIIIDPEGVPRHFEPTLWMLPLLVAVMMTTIHKRLIYIMSGVLIVLIVWASATDARVSHLYTSLNTEKPKLAAFEKSVEALTKRIEEIRERQGYETYTFFNIEALGGTHFRVSPYMYWDALEKSLDTRLERSTNKVTGDFRPTHDNSILFFVCLKHVQSYMLELCKEDIKEVFPNHIEIQNVFYSEEITVLELRKSEL